MYMCISTITVRVYKNCGVHVPLEEGMAEAGADVVDEQKLSKK
jgi:hypothetical protein